MKKQLIKVIKQTDGSMPASSAAKKGSQKNKPSIENTVQSWITERRDKADRDDRLRNSQFSAWNTDAIPAEAV